MIKDVCSQTIDFSKIERVGPVSGDPDWLRYTVYFTGGQKIEFYQKRMYADSHPLDQIKREDFIKMWKESGNDGDWLSPIPSEREQQEKQLKEIWPNYPNECPKWQTMNGLLYYTNEYLKQNEKTTDNPPADARR